MPSKTDAAVALGRALVEARAAGVPWKELQRQTGYGRTRLWMLWREASAAAPMFMNTARVYGRDRPVEDE